ncbi:hypothetical protein SESBI_08203 [Sesbania bispinosa]|nr:hypothetical protein SESBI_08203 [Sesbania bispinosa]
MILAISSLPLPSPPDKALNSSTVVSSFAPLWSHKVHLHLCTSLFQLFGLATSLCLCPTACALKQPKEGGKSR